jgi:hypothetical protein
MVRIQPTQPNQPSQPNQPNQPTFPDGASTAARSSGQKYPNIPTVKVKFSLSSATDAAEIARMRAGRMRGAYGLISTQWCAIIPIAQLALLHTGTLEGSSAATQSGINVCTCGWIAPYEGNFHQLRHLRPRTSTHIPHTTYHIPHPRPHPQQ